MALGGQHVLGFSPDGRLFALINDQGILRIWDTETNELKQEFTPNLHLAGPCTAFTWVTVTQSQKAKKDQKSLKASKDSLYIALGNSTGQVTLYSYALGKIERSFKDEGHTGKITSIIYDNHGKLYTCGEDCQIIVWDMKEEKRIAAWSIGNEKPYSMAYLSQSENLVVGSRQIKVYSATTQELVQTFTGHTSEVNLMSSFLVNDSVEYAVTTSKMERIICLWKIGKKGRNKSPSCTLLMEDIAHCLTCHVDTNGNLKVASVTRSGVLHVYLIAIESLKAEKPIKPKVTIEIASDSSTVIQPIPAVAASLRHGKLAQQILFGYGDKRFMIFEQLALNFEEKMQVLVRSDPKKLYASKSGKKGEQGTDSALKVLNPVVRTKDVEYKSSIAVPKRKLKSVELPMESRLQNLNLNAPAGKVTPQAQSKVQLLVQALHSKNAKLLRSVLTTNDMSTIKLTLQKLPVQYVGILVNALTEMMQQKRVNVAFAINWLKVLAQTHSSQLMAHGAEDLLNKFGPCLGIIEHRANCLKELSKLNGRLQLLVSQIQRNTKDDDINSENLLVYEDNDSSNSDYEDTVDKSASDGEWEEDDDNMEEDVDDDEEMLM